MEANQILRTRIAITGGAGGPKVSTFHFTGSGTAAATAAAAATKLQTLWNTLRMQTIALTFTLEDEVAVIDTSTGFQVDSEIITPWTVVSGGSGEPLPPSTQILCQWRSGVYVTNPSTGKSREVRGRTFVPQVQDSANNSGILAAAERTTVTTACNAFLGGTTAVPVIYSRSSSAAYVITSATVWSDFAILRSRRD